LGWEVNHFSKRKMFCLIIVTLIVVASSGAYYHLSHVPKSEKGKLQPENSPTETSPSITGLKWEPTRVVNSKVYDGIVYFVGRGHELSEVHLVFTPKNYTHFPKEAFPQESSRRFALEPLDGAFDEDMEEFLADITDIKGGREYEIEIVVRDREGVATANLITPYIREFENVASLDDVLIGAYYYPWYSSHRHWQEGYRGTPLLGEYDSRAAIVISKHIDWATGHGIDAFIMSWWGPSSFEDMTIKDCFLNNSLINDTKIAILYESLGRLKTRVENGIKIDLDDPSNREVLLSDIRYLTATYFGSPHYLKISNASVVELYLARIFKGNVCEVVGNLREQTRDGGHNMYLIGDLVYWQNPLVSLERERIGLYDAITAYNMHTNSQEILDDFEDNVARKYSKWLSVAKDLGVGFIPSAIPGFDDRAVRTGNIPLPKSTDRLRKQMEIAKTYMDSNLKIVIITTFNEWHEYTNVEVSVEDSYEYLETIEQCRQVD